MFGLKSLEKQLSNPKIQNLGKNKEKNIIKSNKIISNKRNNNSIPVESNQVMLIKNTSILKNNKNNKNKKNRNTNNNSSEPFISGEITLIKDPSILKNNKEFPTFEYEGCHGFQTVKITLNKKEDVIKADGGAMNYMGGNINMDTKMLGGGGVFNFFGKVVSAVAKPLSGSSLFYNEFKLSGDEPDIVTFSSPNPGNIGCFYIPANKSFNFVSDTYICSTSNLEISTNIRTGGFLLGYGLTFVNVRANSTAGLIWCSAFGDVIDIKLKQGKSIKVDNGVLLGFNPEININTRPVSGFKSLFLSGEGFISEISNKNNKDIDIDIYLQSRSKISYNDYISHIAKNAVR
jgi:hypothetical protein